MALVLEGSVGTGESNTSNNTVSASVTSAPEVGNSLIAIGTNQTDTIGLTSVSDGTSNDWDILLAGGTDGQAVWVAHVHEVVDATATTVTATLSGSDVNKLLWVVEFSGLGVFQEVKKASVLFNGTARNVGGNTVTPPPGGAIIGVYGIVTLGGESALTPAAGFTNFPTATGSGYLNGTAVNGFIEAIWREKLTGSAEQPTATGGASPIGYDAAVLAFLTPPAKETLHVVRSGMRW